MDGGTALNEQIAARVRSLRAAQSLSLDELAAKSGVSRSMISLVERGETSPTAVVLDKLATGLGVVLHALFEASTPETPKSPLARRDEQPMWQDPESGYQRRSVSPTGRPQPMRLTEVLFPAGARVAFENGGAVRVHQQVWLLEGRMVVTAGGETHRLREGDCLAMDLDLPTMFHNPARKRARYAVIVAAEGPSR
jgi:transcriptional regulator with XRE-family HTH domain